MLAAARAAVTLATTTTATTTVITNTATRKLSAIALLRHMRIWDTMQWHVWEEAADAASLTRAASISQLRASTLCPRSWLGLIFTAMMPKAATCFHSSKTLAPNNNHNQHNNNSNNTVGSH